MSTSGGFGRHFLSGAFWTLVQLFGRQAIQSLAFFAFAWFMTPESFGIAAMATSLGFLGRLVVERGVADQVIQRPGLSARSLSTTFWLAMLFGLAMALLLAGTGWIVSASNPALGPVLPFAVAALVPLCVAPGQVHEGLIRRQAGFRQLAGLQMAVSAASVAVSLGLLMLGAGIWAVIGFVLAEAIFKTAGLWSLNAWRPDWQFDRQDAWAQCRFSGAVVLGAVLTVGNLRIVEIVLGSMLGPAAAGYFRLGVQVNRLLTQVLRTPVSKMMLPGFARLTDPGRIAARLLDVMVLASLVTLPFFVLAAAGAPDLFELVMGAEWRPAGEAALWICLGIYAQILPPLVNPVLIAQGRPMEGTRLAAVIFASGLCLAVAGALLQGLTGAAAGLAATAVFALPYTIALTVRNFELAAAEILRAVAAPFAASAAAFAAAAAMLHGQAAPAPGRLAAALLLGGGVYLLLAAAGVWILDRPRAKRLAPLLKKRSGPPAADL
ncbi:oligosaccharide flippase family protein [Leisingera sp. JC11]|uniref:oligosaccharide flippase family protein n=1 Tax=Leisingera sp. JC11 TaxID=3042469 RepID=UPI0034552392